MRSLALLCLSLVLPCATQAANFGYSHVEGGYADYDDENGLYVGGRFAFRPDWHVVAEFNSLDNLDITELGAGYHTAIADKLDAYGQIKYVDIDFDDGLGLTGALRFALDPRFELAGGLNYYNFDRVDSETNLFVRGAFTFADNLAFVMEVENGDLLDKLQLGVRYDF